MRVLVLGGSRGVGLRFAERALAAGHDVTLFARRPAAVAVHSPRLRVVQGDARERGALVAAVPGHDAVLVSLGPHGGERFQRFITPATRWTVEAMEAAGARRLLFMSAVGVGDSRRDAPALFRWFVAPLLLRTTYGDRGDAEEAVKRSRLAWTIVRPLWLTNGKPTGRWRTNTRAREVRGGIPRDDVAAFLVRQLEDDEFVRQAVSIEGA